MGKSKAVPDDSGRHEPLLKPKDALAEDARNQWLKKSRLLLYTVLLLVTSVGNTVFFKRMTSAMPNYGWYLTQLSTVIYVPFFGVLAGQSIASPKKDLIQKFALMGVFDGLSGTLMVLGGVHTSGTMQVLLGQAVIPVTMFCSILFIGKRFHFLQHAGAGTIVLGIVLAKVHASMMASGHGAGAEQDSPIFNAIFSLAIVPTALSSVFKEVAFRGFDGDLDVNVLQFWVAAFQVVVNFLAMPVYTLNLLGPQKVPLSEMLGVTVGGSRCLFLLEDQVRFNCGLPGEKSCDHCHSAWTSVAGYLAFNLLFNIYFMLVIKHGSASLSFLVSTLRMPLSSIAFSCPLIMGAAAVRPSFGDFMSLAVILVGLCTYRYGGKLLKRQLRLRASEPMPSPSDDLRDSTSPPESWQRSPTDGSPASPSQRSRWSFVPLFSAANPGMQPVFVGVPHMKPMPRTAERVRTDLLRRLGAASPLASPRLRHLSPNSPAASPPPRWGPRGPPSPDGNGGHPAGGHAGHAGHAGHGGSSAAADFSMSGLPP